MQGIRAKLSHLIGAHFAINWKGEFQLQNKKLSLSYIKWYKLSIGFNIATYVTILTLLKPLCPIHPILPHLTKFYLYLFITGATVFFSSFSLDFTILIFLANSVEREESFIVRSYSSTLLPNILDTNLSMQSLTSHSFFLLFNLSQSFYKVSIPIT